MKRSFFFLFVLLAAVFASCSSLFAQGAIRPVELSGTLQANDDDSTGAIRLNLGEGPINFYGQRFSSVYVNNNGNITFGDSLSDYTPRGLQTGVGLPIIAPFFADVDTYGEGSGLVHYGNATINGRQAFVASYIGVGYFDSNRTSSTAFR